MIVLEKEEEKNSYWFYVVCYPENLQFYLNFKLKLN